MHFAVRLKNLEAIELMLKGYGKVDLSVKNKDGLAPIHIAVNSSDLASFTMIYKEMRVPNIPTKDFSTPNVNNIDIYEDTLILSARQSCP